MVIGVTSLVPMVGSFIGEVIGCLLYTSIALTAEDEEALAALLESDIAELVGEDGTEEQLYDCLLYTSRCV